MYSGDLIDSKYEVIEQIGEGGMGFVYKVKQLPCNDIFALKICNESDDGSIRRFKREVRIMSETIHKNIVKVIDHNLEYDPPYFVMPLAKVSVADILPKIMGDYDKVLSIFEELCSGIIALHSSGKYHRDIKPSNVLIYEDGRIVVSDLGLAKKIIKDSSTHQSSNYFLGTQVYAAPEQIYAKNCDARTDVFQLSKTFYEMFTGDYPFLMNHKKLPMGLSFIIKKATEIDPDSRYQTVDELLRALRSYQKSLNPALNPVDVLTTKLNEIEDLLKQGSYNEDTCRELLHIIDGVKTESNLFIEYFDKIPNQILNVFASQLSGDFESVFNIYTENLFEYFNNNSIDFSYADAVASKMSVIFNSTTLPEFKGIAIRNTLRVAVWCNRFNAMSKFDSMLQKVKNNDEAVIVNEILNQEIELYKVLVDRVPQNNLHTILLDARTKAIEMLKKDNEELEEKRKKWLAEDIL